MVKSLKDSPILRDEVLLIKREYISEVAELLKKDVEEYINADPRERCCVHVESADGPGEYAMVNISLNIPREYLERIKF